MENLKNSTNLITNIQIIIETDKIIKYCKDKGITPSQKPEQPTGIGHDCGYMVASNNKGTKGSGTGDLVFSASVGDTVRFNAISEYNNFDNPVLLYRIDKYGGANVFGDFISRKFTKMAVMPKGKEIVPPDYMEMPFWFYETSIEQKGTENFNIKIALYIRKDGVINPVLYGYFYWDPSVEVVN